MFGSLLGGRWSDRTRRIYQLRNGGVSRSEVRSVFVGQTAHLLITSIGSIEQYQSNDARPTIEFDCIWMDGRKEDQHCTNLCCFVHYRIFIPVSMSTAIPKLLFTESCSWIYSSTLAYIVDANAGRSSSAVAVNSFFRGLAAFIAAEVAIPLHVRILLFFLTSITSRHLECVGGRWPLYSDCWFYGPGVWVNFAPDF